MLTSTFENAADPNPFESVKNSLFEHKKASLLTTAKGKQERSYIDQGLPSIGKRQPNYTDSDNNSLTNIKKRKGTGKPFVSPR